MDILSEQGLRAIEAAEAEADPTSLGAAERLRREFPADLAAQALTQAALRRRAEGRLPHASQMFFTSDGLQQATRPRVAAWRARRFAAAGLDEVWDLGCGLGSDAMAFADAGIRVTGVEADGVTAAFATANLALVGAPPVIRGRAEDARVPEGAGVFLDPARRTARGRTWDVADFTPPWALVAEYLAGEHFTCVKLGPGLPKNLIPDGVAATWVSEGGQVVEVSLWNGLEPGPAAVVFPRGDGEPVVLRRGDSPQELPVAGVGRFVIEPDNAVIRAGLVAWTAPTHDVWLLDPQIAYLSSDTPIATPLADVFEVLEELPFDVRSLRALVGRRGLGTLEIKCRGVDLDPAELRRALRPRGAGSATIIVSRTPTGAIALLTRRVQSD